MNFNSDEDDALSIGCDSAELFDDSDEDLIPELNDALKNKHGPERKTAIETPIDEPKLLAADINNIKQFKIPKIKRNAAPQMNQIPLSQFYPKTNFSSSPQNSWNMQRPTCNQQNSRPRFPTPTAMPLNAYPYRNLNHNQWPQLPNLHQFLQVPTNSHRPLIQVPTVSQTGPASLQNVDQSSLPLFFDPEIPPPPPPPDFPPLQVPYPSSSLLPDIFTQKPKTSVKDRLGDYVQNDAALAKVAPKTPQVKKDVAEKQEKVTRTSVKSPPLLESNAENFQSIPPAIESELINFSEEATQGILKLTSKYDLISAFGSSDEGETNSETISSRKTSNPVCPEQLSTIRYPFGKSVKRKIRHSGTDSYSDCVVRIGNLLPGDTIQQVYELWSKVAGIQSISVLNKTSASVSFNSKIGADWFFDHHKSVMHEGLKIMGTRVVASHFPDKNLTGVSQLLEDLQRLAEDHESADVLFLLGRDETPVYAHRIILMARCKSFQNAKRGELCRIPGSSVTPPAQPGGPAPIRLPHVQGSVFRQFILYVYTGKILLQDSAVFEMLSLATDLGVEELRSTCEDYVTSTLSPLNAATFLAAVMDIQERTAGGKGMKAFLDRIVAYIGENAAECVQTHSFLTLPKDALVNLISSDFLALEEEDVWRAVLSWAKYQAGVTQPTAHWTGEERVRVGQHLSGVINHVRLLLIDSQVFAEEVEPTGAVPMELSLERYRHAALPNKFRERSEDSRLQPRVSLKLFAGSQILTQNRTAFQRVLNHWHGNPKQAWRLVFRASAHGFSAEAFHRHCDAIAPTYVIVLGTRGEVCGGFSDMPWGKTTSKSHYIPSDKAFLFTLANNEDIPARKFHLVKKPFALCYHRECGPIFGAGADLLLSNNCNVNMDSYSNLPHSYDGEDASSSLLMGDYNFSVVDYEIFTPVNK